LKHYKNKEKIGEGGSGEVWLSECVEDGALVATKILRAKASKDELARFRREIRILAALNHPNIVPILASQLERAPYWYIMPFYKTSLAAELPWLIGDNSRIPRLFGAILDAVAYAHSKGVIHRDLKSANVLMTDYAGFAPEMPGLVVSDFGLGRNIHSVSSRATDSEVVFGTLAYMAPEQMRAAKYADTRSDIFSLGRMLYELYAGPLSAAVPRKIPGGVGLVVSRATEMLPDDRYQTVKAMKQAWLRIVRLGRTDFEAQRFEQLRRRLARAWEPEENVAEFAELLVRRLPNDELLHRVVRKVHRNAFAVMYERHPDAVRYLVDELVKSVRGAIQRGAALKWVGVVCERLFIVIPDREVRAALVECVMYPRTWARRNCRKKMLAQIHTPEDVVIAQRLRRRLDTRDLQVAASDFRGQLDGLAPAIRELLVINMTLDDIEANEWSGGDDSDIPF
jgi:tRNA A-37 threonylcarbamoyl transferase component Bud32